MNFILIICDALRYDRVNEDYMPGLNELSKKGTKFTFCLTGGGNTQESMPFILCSKKDYDDGENIGSILKESGFNTAMIHSNLLLNKFKYGFDLEVDVYLKTVPRAREIKTTRRMLRKAGVWKRTRGIRKAIRKARGKEKWEIPYRRAENIIKEADKHLDTAFKPWFLWLHLMDAHIPYYPLSYQSFTTWDRVEQLNRKIIDAIHKQKPLNNKEKKEVEQLYNEEVRYMDEHLTKFIKERNNDAYIIITSDHGDEFGEYGFYSHSPGKHGLIPQLTHVPLIFLGSKIKSQIIESYASSLDIAPTILGLAEIDKKLGYGRDLTKLLSSES